MLNQQEVKGPVQVPYFFEETLKSEISQKQELADASLKNVLGRRSTSSRTRSQHVCGSAGALTGSV